MEGDVMRRQPWGLYAIALAILVVGLAALGVPASTLLLAALVLTCPLMMIFMMSGMHGGHDTADQDREPGSKPGSQTSDNRDREPTAGRR
jgi:Protein of unknown function (DUF2933)